MLDAYPNLKKMYSATDDNTQVLYLKDAVATFASFTALPEWSTSDRSAAPPIARRRRRLSRPRTHRRALKLTGPGRCHMSEGAGRLTSSG